MAKIKLTRGEEKVLRSLFNGYTNSQISEEQNITVNTVKYHLKKIYRKIGARNRTEAVLKSNNLLTKK